PGKPAGGGLHPFDVLALVPVITTGQHMGPIDLMIDLDLKLVRVHRMRRFRIENVIWKVWERYCSGEDRLGSWIELLGRNDVVGEWSLGSRKHRLHARSREVARSFQRSRNDRFCGIRFVLAETRIASEVERAVFDNRTAEAGSELIPPQRGFGHRVPRVCIQ